MESIALSFQRKRDNVIVQFTSLGDMRRVNKLLKASAFHAQVDLFGHHTLQIPRENLSGPPVSGVNLVAGKHTNSRSGLPTILGNLGAHWPVHHFGAKRYPSALER